MGMLPAQKLRMLIGSKVITAPISVSKQLR